MLRWFDRLCLVLGGVGALNWTLASFDYNVVAKFVPLAYVNYVYYAVSAAGLYAVYAYWKK